MCPPSGEEGKSVKLLIIYLAGINLLGFALMGADKKRARENRRRIRERTLLLTAAAGGSVGVALGMVEFRHKTRHRQFTVGVPAMLLLQAALCVLAATKLAG